MDAAGDGLALFTWERDTFAYADSYDEATGRYRGLRLGQSMNIGDGNSGLLVKPEAARAQADAERPTTPPPTDKRQEPKDDTGKGSGTTVITEPPPMVLRRFHGSVTIDPTRLGRDAGRVADEVVSHVAGLVGSKVRVTLEIQADIPGGVPDKVVRIVTENCRTLKFQDQGFEES